MDSCFELQRKIGNKIWATRNTCRPVIAKRTRSLKKVMLVVFSTSTGLQLQFLFRGGKQRQEHFTNVLFPYSKIEKDDV